MQINKELMEMLVRQMSLEERKLLQETMERKATEPVMKVLSNGTKEWRLPNGQLHRTNGPAIECTDGSKAWYLNGQCHRTDGPAVEDADGYKAWYLNGKQVSEKDVLGSPSSCKDKIVEIDGKKYKLTEV